MSGVEDDRLAIWLAALTAFINFVFTLVGVWLVERMGRRKLTLGSLTGECLISGLYIPHNYGQSENNISSTDFVRIALFKITMLTSSSA